MAEQGNLASFTKCNKNLVSCNPLQGVGFHSKQYKAPLTVNVGTTLVNLAKYSVPLIIMSSFVNL